MVFNDADAFVKVMGRYPVFFHLSHRLFIPYYQHKGNCTRSWGRENSLYKGAASAGGSGRKGHGMKEKVIGFLQDLVAGLSIFVFLFFLYILMTALG